MNILLLSHNFPPEVNAGANRSYEHAREWVAAGANVDVITDVPHFPEGRVYSGYRNRASQEEVDGIQVTRVPSYIAENKRKLRRIFSYVTFMFSAVLYSYKVRRKPDVVLATSPQIFTAVAGYILSLWHRVPFVMEVRDLWPQSIRAVGAFKSTLILSAVQFMVDTLYRGAAMIIIVSEAFREEIERSGIPSEKIHYIPNGFALDRFSTEISEEEVRETRERHNLGNKFVVSYIGTLGMAHALETIVDAARLSEDPEVLFLIAGTGANEEALRAYAEGVENVRLISKLPREEALKLLKASDVSLIHLKDNPVFRTVLPSKMFEAMAFGKPIILGVRGEAERLLAMAKAGVAIEPESPEAINGAVEELRVHTGLFGQLGARYIKQHHCRSVLARTILELVRSQEASTPLGGSGSNLKQNTPSTNLNHHHMVRQVPESQGTVDYFDTEANNWSERCSSSATFQKRLRIVSNWIPNSEGCTALDFGCGSGVFVAKLVSKGYQTTGVDIALKMLEAARLHCAEFSQDQCRLLTTSAWELEQAKYDVVCCLGVLEYVEDDLELLSALTQVVAEEGSLILSVPNARSSLRTIEKLVHSFPALFRLCGLFSHLTKSDCYLSHQKHQYALKALTQNLRNLGFELARKRFYAAPRWLAFLENSEYCGMSILVEFKKTRLLSKRVLR